MFQRRKQHSLMAPELHPEVPLDYHHVAQPVLEKALQFFGNIQKYESKSHEGDVNIKRAFYVGIKLQMLRRAEAIDKLDP